MMPNVGRAWWGIGARAFLHVHFPKCSYGPGNHPIFWWVSAAPNKGMVLNGPFALLANTYH